MLSIQEYAEYFGSDEKTIYTHASNFIESGSLTTIAPKFWVSSLLIALASQFSTYALLMLFILKFMFYLFSVHILLGRIRKYVSKQPLYLYAAFLYLNPVFHAYHTTLLRDDLILSAALIFVALSIQMLDQNLFSGKPRNLVTSFFLLAVLVFIFGLRPELSLLFIVFLFLCFFVFSSSLVRFGLAGLAGIFLLNFFEIILEFYSFALSQFRGLSLFNIIEAFRLFYLSPAPWNITMITDVETDASKAYVWFYVSFFTTLVSFVLLLKCTIQQKLTMFKFTADNPIGIWFLYMPIFITVCFGVMAGPNILGPRQGMIPSALLTLIFLIILVFELSPKNSSKG
ncbi:hypothetical protein N9Y23_02565 [Pseudomonadales bacterium]|nr:hypothetical protein [Pseudomonadales bacterium]